MAEAKTTAAEVKKYSRRKETAQTKLKNRLKYFMEIQTR